MQDYWNCLQKGRILDHFLIVNKQDHGQRLHNCYVSQMFPNVSNETCLRAVKKPLRSQVFPTITSEKKECALSYIPTCQMLNILRENNHSVNEKWTADITSEKNVTLSICIQISLTVEKNTISYISSCQMLHIFTREQSLPCHCEKWTALKVTTCCCSIKEAAQRSHFQAEVHSFSTW